jgi:hypothetical protein
VHLKRVILVLLGLSIPVAVFTFVGSTSGTDTPECDSNFAASISGPGPGGYDTPEKALAESKRGGGRVGPSDQGVTRSQDGPERVTFTKRDSSGRFVEKIEVTLHGGHWFVSGGSRAIPCPPDATVSPTPE